MMNRSWITALTLATVAGSGAAFTGVLANSTDLPASAQSPTPFNQAAYLRVEPQAPATRATTYQVGAAGVATLAIASGSLTITHAEASTGWGVTSASVPGTHIDLQFTDGTQLVTFGADLVGDQVVVSLTNLPVTPVTIAAEPVAVAVTPTTELATTTSEPQPATPPPTAAPAAPQPPAAAATTAPSGSGDDGDDNHEGNSNDD